MEKPGLKATTETGQYKVVVVTVSDSCARGERDDLSGPRCRDILETMGMKCLEVIIVPDDLDQLVGTMEKLCDLGRTHLIVTTGGTGLSPRDVTPEATRLVIQREAPGFGELLRLEGYRKKPTAMLSRATAGVRNGVLIVNLPGSVRGVSEGLESLKPILGHALDVTAGETTRCGG